MPSSLFTVAPAEIGRAAWVVEAARSRGMRVAGLEVPGPRHYWGGPAWAVANSDQLEVALLEPSEDWLSDLPEEWLHRGVALMTLSEAQKVGRAFIKPPTSKDFPARVYESGRGLASATAGFPLDTKVLVSEVVEFAAEYRLFVLDGRIVTGSRYATWGHPDPGTLLSAEAQRVCDRVKEMLDQLGDTLPSAVVVDAGLLGPPDDPRREVAIVEANMAWFAQPYWAEPDRVLDVVLRSAGPAHDVSSRDERFVTYR